MPQFSYKARRRTGEVVEGVLEVADRSAALVQIERLGLFPVAVDAAKGGAIARRRRTARRAQDGLARPVAAHLAGGAVPEAQTQTPGTGHLHAAVGQPAQLRHAADRRAQQHDAPGVQRHFGRGQQGAEAGRDGGPEPVRLDGQAAAHLLRSVRQHGAGGRIQRRAGRGAAAHGRPFRAVCRRCSRSSPPRWSIRPSSRWWASASCSSS